MRDDLAHIRNRTDERRRTIIARHEDELQAVFRRHPDLKAAYSDMNQVKKLIISATLAKLKGQADDGAVVELEKRLEASRSGWTALLKKRGLEPDFLEPKWQCALCQDTGMVYTDDEKYVPCQCALRRKEEQLRSSITLPARLAKASFTSANFDLYQLQYRSQAQKIFGWVQNYCAGIEENSGQGLFIHGPTGSGKSYLMGCIANCLCNRLSVKYLVYADFLDCLRATFNSRETEYTEQQLVDEVKTVDLLLLDDLGVEKATEFSLKNLAQIIDYRYRNCLPMVVTSNFTLEEMIQRSQTDLYGERIVWRLSECCSNILELKGNLRLNL